MPIIAGILGVVSTFFKGIFDFKGEQARTVQSALSTLQAIDANDAQSITASAQALQAILTQGSWLEKQWRPFLMILLMLLIGCWFFGYVPPNFDAPVSPMMREVLDLLKVGVIGYVPCRTIEKVITQINIGSILKQLISKKVV